MMDAVAMRAFLKGSYLSAEVHLQHVFKAAATYAAHFVIFVDGHGKEVATVIFPGIL